MRIAFEINSRQNKDGRNNIRIRVSNGRNVTPIKFSTPINIYKEYWDKKDERVTNQHIEFASVNRALKVFKERKEYCMAKWEAGQFTIRNVANYMEGVTDYSSLDAFVSTVLKRRMTDVSFTDVSQKLNIIKGHMGIKGELQFKEINRNFYYELLEKLVAKGLSKNSIKSYSIAIGSVLKKAHDEGVIQEIPKRPKEFTSGKGGVRRKDKTTVTPEIVEQAIKEAKNISQWQSVGFWLLEFCMRGLYPADIVKMTEANLDVPTQLKRIKNEIFIEHPRSKSEHTENEDMYIHIDNMITYPLISMLKNSVVKTHHNRRDIVADVNDRLKIFDYNPTQDYKKHNSRWALHTRRLRKYGMNMKNARKTFLTYAKELSIDEDTRLILVGRKNDPIFSSSYDNNRTKAMVDKVSKAHKSILSAFEAQRLVELLWAKLHTFKTPAWLTGDTGEETWKTETGKELIKMHPDYMKYKWYWRNYIAPDYTMSKTEEKMYFKYLKEKGKAATRVVKLYPKVATA